MVNTRFGACETNDAHAQMVKAAERLCRLTLIAVLLVGHVSQAAARAGITDHFATRGGTALTDNARSALTISALTQENISRYAPGAHLSEDEMERFVVLAHPKANGPKATPLLLERDSNEHGPFFRLANLKDRGMQSRAALYEQPPERALERLPQP